ncbi:hypothetical protein CC1G_01345 [Coprinopsis cinerea okayama7|uniref:C2H2-type domain-containing protein n=1 Tax=Coprinopsis cinerea (strain Okayama-7 / 130 / ATCC MYA-4618 / FGSC 9003) TaxID=240176 RepID=A8NYH9_COPC7|nr:hypothetical protein CC1G_01345 [Coprinopsis cinerea okayama7\|eukprot:XP_001837433.1 hypothetical protein CC1G_01345 [Coprinopsis cinerea okayama7\
MAKAKQSAPRGLRQPGPPTDASVPTTNPLNDGPCNDSPPAAPDIRLPQLLSRKPLRRETSLDINNPSFESPLSDSSKGPINYDDQEWVDTVAFGRSSKIPVESIHGKQEEVLVPIPEPLTPSRLGPLDLISTSTRDRKSGTQPSFICTNESCVEVDKKTGRRTYKKAFVRRGDYNRHCALHSGLKPFECPECGKRFSQNSGLKTHLNIHNDLRPHACGHPGCDKTFADPSSRTRHRKEKHLHPLPYWCPVRVCTFKNKRPSIFKKHLMENHGVNADGFDIEMYSGKERTQVINNHKQFQQSLSHDYDEYLPVAAQRRRRRSSASSTPYSRKRSKKDKGPDGYPPLQSNISYSPDGHLSKEIRSKGAFIVPPESITMPSLYPAYQPQVRQSSPSTPATEYPYIDLQACAGYSTSSFSMPNLNLTRSMSPVTDSAFHSYLTQSSGYPLSFTDPSQIWGSPNFHAFESPR